MALVGRERYKLSPLGINFWLIYEQGWLQHNSDSIPKKLFQPNLFEWYIVDTLLDLDGGEYSLQISNEADALLTDLTHQPMAAGKSDHYSLKEYSFVGDLADTAPADFYIDDIYISTTNNTKPPQLVAPGRRKYFYEIWDDYHRQLQGKMRCLPARSLADFGINASDYAALGAKGQLEALYDATQTHVSKLLEPTQTSIELAAVKDWANACQNLAQEKPDKARANIKQALEKKPNAYIFQFTQLIVDAASDPADTGLYSRALALPNERDDLRRQIVLSMLAFHNQRYAEAGHQPETQTALAWLNQLNAQDIKLLSDLGLQALSDNYIAQLQRLMPDRWEKHRQWMLILEQQYYSYLWQGKYNDAYALATRITKALAKHSIIPGIWLERQADGAFLAKDLDKALDLYNHQAPLSLGSLLKMADMYHMQGDLASEKSIRESIYKNFARK